MHNVVLRASEFPVVLFVEGNGTGPDMWRASRHELDSAAAKAYGGRRRIECYEVLAGEKAFNSAVGVDVRPHDGEMIRREGGAGHIRRVI